MFSTGISAIRLFGMVQMLSSAVRIRVLRIPTESTSPWFSPAWMRSPIRNGRSSTITSVPKKFDSVSREAKAIASPATPAPASSVVMFNWKILCPMKRSVIAASTIFNIFRTMSIISASRLFSGRAANSRIRVLSSVISWKPAHAASSVSQVKNSRASSGYSSGSECSSGSRNKNTAPETSIRITGPDSAAMNCQRSRCFRTSLRETR
ncbi:hypothetical protein SDC9_154106 [bioreactor metagenome]|uniref:Uncharacterized protein n=1 Tax=bioreactor metagenome TaxID=1076179 RepID=A0A645F085_9ZZZZ